MKRLLLLLCAVPVFAQPSVNGPIAGFVFDQLSHAIRPMLGIPGAAYVGPALASGIDAAGIAPDGSSALALQQGQLFLLTPLKGGPPSWTPVSGAIGGADQFAWSAGGAAIYSSVTRQAQILRNLSTTPAASAAIDVSGQVSALAVSGETLLVGIAGSGVYRVHAGGSPELVMPAQNPVALVVSGHDLFAADRDTGQIWQLPNFKHGSEPVLFTDGIDAPAGIHISSGSLFVASAGSRTLTIYDLASRAVSGSIDLAFSPSSLHPMGSSSVLLMANEPYQILDTSGDPAVYFVPAGAGSQ